MKTKKKMKEILRKQETITEYQQKMRERGLEALKVAKALEAKRLRQGWKWQQCDGGWRLKQR